LLTLSQMKLNLEWHGQKRLDGTWQT
jgi:hypothetical protein